MTRLAWLCCTLTSAALGGPSYYADIAPLMEVSCLGCHYSGGPGRIALDTYEQVKRYAPEISLAAGARTMPPTKAVYGFGEFRNAPVLSPEQIRMIVAWSDAGAPEGTRPPPVQRTRRASWQLGDPDVILEPDTEFSVPATGRAAIRCFFLPADFDQPRFVRAVDILPGNPRVVLHARVFADSTGAGAKLDRADPAAGFDCFADSKGMLDRWSLGEWSAGVPPMPLQSGAGRLLPARTGIILEIRYHRLGFATRDRTRVGLYFRPDGDTSIVRTHAIVNRAIAVPPDDWSYAAEATWQIERAIELISVSPHMNLAGSEIKVTAVLPGGEQRPLVWVRDWDRNWQMAYVLRQPVRLPPGSRIDVRALFNNSDDNPNLPAGPRRLLTWNWGPYDERLAAFVEYIDTQ